MSCKSGKRRDRREEEIEKSESQLGKYGIRKEDALPKEMLPKYPKE